MKGAGFGPRAKSLKSIVGGASFFAVSIGLIDTASERRLQRFLRNHFPVQFSTIPPTVPTLPSVLAAQPVASSGDASAVDAAAKIPNKVSNLCYPKSPKWDNNWDLRDPTFLGLCEFPTATRHLFLIRHGQYHIENEEDSERTLTELGRRQLEMTAKRLAEISEQAKVTYDRIIVSTMTRALESAQIISCELKEVPMDCPGDALLREGSPYPPEPPISSWDSKDPQRTGKRLQAFFEDGPRIEAAFRKYFKRASYEQECDSHEVIVCHANVIRYFAMRALQLPPEAWLRISLRNGSITVISISPSGKVSLRALGDAGHMPPDLLTVT